MGEVWIATWFCLAMHDPVCARLEGATGNMTFSSGEMCATFGDYSAHLFRRKHKIPLAYVCTHIIDVYKAAPRPHHLPANQGAGLPWPEIKYTPIDNYGW